MDRQPHPSSSADDLVGSEAQGQRPSTTFSDHPRPPEQKRTLSGTTTQKWGTEAQRYPTERLGPDQTHGQFDKHQPFRMQWSSARLAGHRVGLPFLWDQREFQLDLHGHSPRHPMGNAALEVWISIGGSTFLI
ncbi:MAG: hypothetical protein M1826_007524 [Phylliscum demangeonii]|nr:MAG: hypothetical protein M1826_007524 [Phylliscum demangeonii]